MKTVDSLYYYRLQDGSGEISTEELLGVMRAMGQNPTEDELLSLVMEIDINSDGIIDFDEFVAMMKKKAHEVDDEADLRYFIKQLSFGITDT